MLFILSMGSLTAMDLAQARAAAVVVDREISRAMENRDLRPLRDNNLLSKWAQDNLMMAIADGAMTATANAIIVKDDLVGDKYIRKIKADTAQKTELDMVYLLDHNTGKAKFNDINVIFSNGSYVDVHLSQFYINPTLVQIWVSARNVKIDLADIVSIVKFAMKFL